MSKSYAGKSKSDSKLEKKRCQKNEVLAQRFWKPKTHKFGIVKSDFSAESTVQGCSKGEGRGGSCPPPQILSDQLTLSNISCAYSPVMVLVLSCRLIEWQTTDWQSIRITECRWAIYSSTCIFSRLVSSSMRDRGKHTE